MIKKKIDESVTRFTSNKHRTSIKGDKNFFRMDQAIQTKEMTKEVLYSMSKKLKFNIEIFDNEDIEQSYYLLLTIPIEKHEESDINDFKDEDINEMINKDSVILEEKLKRQLPNSNSFLEARNVSNISGIHVMDLLNKSGEEIKSFDFFSSANKSNMQSHNLKLSEKNINPNDSTNKLSSIRDFNNANGSFLSKCIKPSTNKTKINNTDIESKGNKEKDKERNRLKLRSCFSVKSINKYIQKSDKSQKSDLKSNNSSHKSNGILTMVDKKDKNQVKFDNIGKQMHEISIDMKKDKNDEMTFKEQSGVVSGFGSSIKINESKSINKALNKDNISSGKQIKKNSYFINNSKMKHSCFVSEENGADKKDSNKDLDKKEFILIELEKERKNLSLQKKMNQNISNKLSLHPIKEENDAKLQSSSNKVSEFSNKNGMSFIESDKKDKPLKLKYTKTVIDSNIQNNRSLFLEAINESKNHIEKRKNKINNILIGNSKNSQNVQSQNESEEDSKYLMNSENQCNCADLLVVDDEEFNVMASQRMLHNLGFESDAAYDGKECLNLINNKLKLNCKCEHSFYKIIFLDIVMPIMDGIKTAKKIQEMIDKKLLNCKTVIIFISGNINDINLKNSLLEIQCVKECFQKPVRIDKYQKILEKYYN
jgi:CheY-like chemotaxis protein